MASARIRDPRSSALLALLVSVALCAGFAVGCARTFQAQGPSGESDTAASAPQDAPQPADRAPSGDDLKEKWGVEIAGIWLSAGGFMMDFRYRILDPEKSAPLLDRQHKPYLIHQATGAKFLVPSSPKVGPLRQTTRERIPGRIYYAIFANPGRYVKAGDQVTVVIGDFRAENLTVQ